MNDDMWGLTIWFIPNWPTMSGWFYGTLTIDEAEQMRRVQRGFNPKFRHPTRAECGLMRRR